MTESDEVFHKYAGVLLVTKDERLIGQLRDDKSGIDHPGKVTTFGGTVEEGETPLYAAWRELVQEETNLQFTENDLVLFLKDKAWRELTSEWEVRYFYYIQITDEQLDKLEIYEGQGWTEIKGPDDPRLVDVWRPVITHYLAQARKT